MKKILTLLVSIILISGLTFNTYGIEADNSADSLSTSVQTIDSVVVPVRIEGVNETVKTSKFQDKINELGAPSVNKIITTGKIVWSLIIILIGFLILRLLDALLNRFGSKSVQYRIFIKRIIPIVKIIGWSFVIYIIIQGVIRPPLATVIAFFTSVGVAVGFAAQDLLKNIFGGLMILFDRPFQIGDKIEASNSYGEVIKIGLRSTRIVTADDSVVTIPNAEMMNHSISNSNSGETNCQVVAEFYLPLDIDTQKVRRVATEAAMVSKFIYLNKPVTVLFFNEMKDRRSIIKMRLKAYVSDIQNEFVFKSDMTEITIRELIKEKLVSKEYYN
ncbi:mechanosensitive ion channel family protein [Labilibacter marinus]|uniref:mechanosensitive ion channel family protein n=1 Tax=Labilibacter marinus TaxID=1477105 RepID=UPI00094FC9EA|nr:mechanosensitive ion channel domain-containing protein [Labilibacter marinus]